MRFLMKIFARMPGVALALALVGCSSSYEGSVANQNANDSTGSGEMVNYALRMKEVTFRLSGATAFSISVEGCASGYTSTVTEASNYVAAYKYDIGCLAKLSSLTVSGVTYAPSASAPFTTWLDGDTAVFEDVGGSGKTLNLQVIAQLDNPIPATAPSHGVEYLFSTIEMGNDRECTGDCVENEYGVAISGADAPAFEVDEFRYLSMNSDGSGMFQFKLECSQALVGADTSATCDGAMLSEATYKLVPDTYSGVLSIADATAIMQAGTSMIDNTDVIAAGSDSEMPNGGFITKEARGPMQMHLNPEMILLVQMGANSFKYWNVDITPIVQP